MDSSSETPRSQSLSRAPSALALAILLAAFFLRVHALGEKSLWYDELRQVEVAQSPVSEFSSQLLRHAARPLDYGLTRAWLRGGQQEFWLRYPAALFGLLAVAVMLPVGRRWLPRGRWPLAAMGLLAAAPLGVQYSQEMRPYALYLLFSLLSFYHLEAALGTRRRQPRASGRHWLGFSLASAGGALTHYFYAVVLGAQAVFGIAVVLLAVLAGRRSVAGQHRRAWRSLAGLSAGLAAGVLGLLPAGNPPELLALAGQFASALAGAPNAGGLVSPAGLQVQVQESLNAAFFLDGLLARFGGGPGWALAPFVALALAGLAGLGRHSRPRLALALLWLLAAPAAIMIYLQYRQEFFALRYVLFALPAYVLAISGGLALLHGWLARRAGRRAGHGATMLLLALLVGLQLRQVLAYYAEPKDDWRRVGRFLALNTRPGDTLGAPDVQAFIRFYAPDQVAVIVDANDLGPHEQALENGERFWFVVSDYTLLPLAETQQWALGLPGVIFQLDPRIRVVFAHPGRSMDEVLGEAQGFVVPPARDDGR